MKNIGKLAVILSFIASFSSVNAQVTINQSDLPTTIGTRIKYFNNTNVTVNLGSPGANQLWNPITSGSQNDSTIDVVINPQTAPFIADFSGADYVIERKSTGNDTLTYEYYDFLSDRLNYLGRRRNPASSGIDLNRYKWSPAVKQYDLPLEYGDTWTVNSNATIGSFPLSATVNLSGTATVDGWGIINTPAGSFQCLRVKLKTTLKVSSLLGNDSLKNVSYSWIAKNIGQVMTITSQPNDTNSNFTSASTVQYYNSGIVTSGASNISSEIPEKYLLKQNYPNPFNPETIIEFSVPQTSEVRLAVYDALGREIKVLISRTVQAGVYNTKFTTEGLSSGIYFYRLTAGNFTETKVMTLTK